MNRDHMQVHLDELYEQYNGKQEPSQQGIQLKHHTEFDQIPDQRQRFQEQNMFVSLFTCWPQKMASYFVTKVEKNERKEFF